MRRYLHALCLLVPALLLPAVPAVGGDDRDHDHDRARRALQAGDILPLATLLERTGIEAAGRLIEVELEQKHGRPLYELKVLTPEGRVMKHVVDARSGEVVKTEGKAR